MTHNLAIIGGDEPPITHSGSFNALSYNCGELQTALKGSSELSLAMQQFLLVILDRVNMLCKQCEALEAQKRNEIAPFIKFFKDYEGKEIKTEDNYQIQLKTQAYNDVLSKYQKCEQTLTGVRENATSEQQSLSNSIEQFIAALQKLVSIIAPARG